MVPFTTPPDIYITKMGMQTQEKELQALTESLAEYYHYYDQPARLPRNMDVDDMLGRKKMLAKGEQLRT